MIGSTRELTEAPVMFLPCSIAPPVTYSRDSSVLVLSCPWAPHLTVGLLVSLSLLTGDGDASTSAAVRIFEIGWQEQRSLSD